MARKIGFDLLLPHLEWREKRSPVLVALDADTVVDPDYLAAITDHFSGATSGGAVIPFRHRPAPTPAGQSIIDRYELFLRAYVAGLDFARSPYAFHTVGSAMACTGEAYVACGGMNTRRAAEDFYFLQQVKKTSGIGQVRGTTVHPSPRPSNRVPFGTGRSVAKAMAGEGSISFYRPECFLVLRDWLAIAETHAGASSDEVVLEASVVSGTLARFLEQERFSEAWDRIARIKRDRDVFAAAFHEWFDGLRTMKLVHALSAEVFPRCEPEESVMPLLELAGHAPVSGVANQLTYLRSVQ